jgi:SAM-dependent methyltransferase
MDIIITGKHGLEIGGPSIIATTIYANAQSLDNVVFDPDNIWSTFNDNIYRYYEDKHGTVIIDEASLLSTIPNNRYDFIFSAHTFEHIANPLKALYNWVQVLKPHGYIILVVPEKTVSFDHRRPYSSFEKVLDHYKRNVGEDDLSCLSEVLSLHDLNRDSERWTFEEFYEHSTHNYRYRTLHHFVYNSTLLRQMCEYIGCRFVYTKTEGINLWFVMQK